MGSLPRPARLRRRRLPRLTILPARLFAAGVLPAGLLPAGLVPARLGRAGRGSVAVGLLAACAATAVLAAPFSPHGDAAPAVLGHPTDPPSAHRPLAGFLGEAREPLALPPASAPPAPPPPDLAAAPPLRRHEIFGFAPYWTLDQSWGFDLRSLSTLAYFGLGINPDGSLNRSGDGWDGYNSADLTALITRSHQARARVVLTVTDFDDTAIHQMLTSPGSAARLAQQLSDAIRAKNMDGANLDVEATGGGDRAAYVTFVTQVARTLHAANPHWQVTVDTYAGSAQDSASFFDVHGLDAAVDAFFVMAYDMYGDGSQAQPNAPLANYGWNDTSAMAAYTQTVSSAKVLLGTPFYGYDWQVADNSPNARTVGDARPMTYADIHSANHPVQWDQRGSVPFTAYRAGDGSWHETYYDNPQSLALKAQLVNRFRLRGLGVWALGMDGNDPTMMAALLGHAAPLKTSAAGPGGTPTSSASHAASASSSGAPSPSSPSPSPSPSPQGSPTPGGSSPSPAPSGAPTPPPTPPPLTPPPLPTAPL